MNAENIYGGQPKIAVGTCLKYAGDLYIIAKCNHGNRVTIISLKTGDIFYDHYEVSDTEDISRADFLNLINGKEENLVDWQIVHQLTDLIPDDL